MKSSRESRRDVEISSSYIYISVREETGKGGTPAPVLEERVVELLGQCYGLNSCKLISFPSEKTTSLFVIERFTHKIIVFGGRFDACFCTFSLDLSQMERKWQSK